jgi:hypothetical protein
MNIPTPRNCIHGMNELMDQLGARNILGIPFPLIIMNVLLRIFNALIQIGRLKVRDWMEPKFDQFNHLRLVLYGNAMCFPPMHRFSS